MKELDLRQSVLLLILTAATIVFQWSFSEQLATASETVSLNRSDTPLSVDLTPVSVSNGNLLLLEIDLAHREVIAKSLVVSLAGKQIPLSQHPARTTDTYFALIGISYYATQGATDLILEWSDRFGQHIQTIPIHIREGKYRSERIRVAPRMVSPSLKDLKRIKGERLELKAVYADSLEARVWQSPFENPMTSEITSPFGSRRMFNGKMKSYHSGVDYRAPKGTPVYASNTGTVKLAKSLFFSGNLILIDHGLGLFTQYAHLSKIAVVPGQRIQKGELIGYSGSTGRVSGPHLHWGVKLNGVNIDPLQLIEVSRSLFEPPPPEPAFIGDIVPDIRPSN